jgi:hypothetical protein
MNTPAPAPIPESDCPLIRSRGDFTAAVIWTVRSAVAQGARHIVCTGDGFGDWPLDDAGLLDALGPWLRLPMRRLSMLGRDFESVRSQHPRFSTWRRDYGHALEAWTPPEEMGQLPTLIVSDTALSLQLVDSVHWRGRVSSDERKAHLLREQVDAFLQRSERAFPVHHLGL